VAAAAAGVVVGSDYAAMATLRLGMCCCEQRSAHSKDAEYGEFRVGY